MRMNEKGEYINAKSYASTCALILFPLLSYGGLCGGNSDIAPVVFHDFASIT